MRAAASPAATTPSRCGADRDALHFGMSRRIGPGWLILGGWISGEHTQRESRRWKGREASVSETVKPWRTFNAWARSILGDGEYEGKRTPVQMRRSNNP